MDRFMRFLIRALQAVSGIALVTVATVITLNVFGRTLFHTPILGTIEYAALASVVFASGAVGYAEKQRRNVVMEVVSSRFPPRVKAFTDAFGLLLALAVIGFLAWAMFGNARFAASYGETTLVVKIPLAPFKYIWALGATLLCVILLTNIIQCIRRGVKR